MIQRSRNKKKFKKKKKTKLKNYKRIKKNKEKKIQSRFELLFFLFNFLRLIINSFSGTKNIHKEFFLEEISAEKDQQQQGSLSKNSKTASVKKVEARFFQICEYTN